MDRDNELGEFLRARRDLVTPRDAGLPDDGERRVPGLRREEVALLAGVSTDYYTRLEQGRERRPSDQVLDAIARALRLDDPAVTHLFRLALPAPSSAPRTSPAEVSPELRALLRNFVGVPATVVGPALDVLAANSHAVAFYSGFARLDNLLRMIFLDPAAKEFYADWDHTARSAVASLRAASGPFAGDPRVVRVIGELTMRSPVFATLWGRYEVRPRTSAVKTVRHPVVGELRLHHQAFTVLDAPGQQLNVYSAEPGSPAADGLALLGSLSAEAPRDQEHERKQ